MNNYLLQVQLLMPEICYFYVEHHPFSEMFKYKMISSGALALQSTKSYCELYVNGMNMQEPSGVRYGKQDQLLSAGILSF